MVKMSDVAKRAGVSIATVSNVINKNGKVVGKTEKRVLQAIEDLHYIPNYIIKGIQSNYTQSIGVISEDLSISFTTDIVDGISEYCEKNKYVLNIYNLRLRSKMLHSNEVDYSKVEFDKEFQKSLHDSINALAAAQVGGLIYIGAHPRDISNLLAEVSIPTIYTFCYTRNDDYCINNDDFQGAKLAVDYLIENGHHRIAIICGSVNSIPAHQRLIAYQTSLMEHGLTFYPDYVCSGNWRYCDGYRACQKLMSLDSPPTAIFSMNDLMAFGAINYAKEKNLSIPEQLSIVGFDDVDTSSYIYPHLSTVKTPFHEMGMKAAEVAIHLVEGKQDKISEKNILINCALVKRNTVLDIRNEEEKCETAKDQ